MKLSRRKLRQLIAESLNEMSSPMSPMSLDSLKPMMDQNEYEIVSNNIASKRECMTTRSTILFLIYICVINN